MEKNIKKIGYCQNCFYWRQDLKYTNIGKCEFLSGKKNNSGEEEYPDIKKTGIESFPICPHDGPAFDYSTTKEFGCVNYKSIIKKWKQFLKR